jgi:cytochrome c-type biogenesis protein CcmH/NrfF
MNFHVMIDWGLVATWGIPVLALVIGAYILKLVTHRSTKKLDRIIGKLNVVEEDDR